MEVTRTPAHRIKRFLQDYGIGLVIGTALYWLILKPIFLLLLWIAA
jgi:hypothetical protein